MSSLGLAAGLRSSKVQGVACKAGGASLRRQACNVDASSASLVFRIENSFPYFLYLNPGTRVQKEVTSLNGPSAMACARRLTRPGFASGVLYYSTIVILHFVILHFLFYTLLLYTCVFSLAALALRSALAIYNRDACDDLDGGRHSGGGVSGEGS